MDNNTSPKPQDPMQPQQPPMPPGSDPSQQPQQPTQQPIGQQPQSQAANGQLYPETHQTDTLGIISLVLVLILPLAGLIVGFVGKSKAKKMGYSGKLSFLGIILNAIFMVIGTIVFVSLILAGFQTTKELARDTEAKANINAVYERLEVYYNNNGTYPESITSQNLPGADSKAIEAVTSESRYQYLPSGCIASQCRAYTLSYDLEVEDTFGNNTYLRRSFN